MVWNLLINAVKFTPAGGRVDVRAFATASDVVLTVRDTGAGIPTDMLPHIFEMFRQVEPAGGRAAGGLGLGLSIARRLVELHGGDIRAESDGPERGAAFIVRLPIASAAQVQDAGAGREPGLTSAATGVSVAAAGRLRFVDRHADGRAPAVAQHGARRGAADLGVAEQPQEVGRPVDRGAVEADDDVPRPQPGGRGFRAAVDTGRPAPPSRRARRAARRSAASAPAA